MRLFSVTVAVHADGDHAALLMLATVLHRRGVEVTEAQLARAAHGQQVFKANFVATPRMAETVLRTFQARVQVLDAVLCDVVGPSATPNDISQTCAPALARLD